MRHIDFDAANCFSPAERASLDRLVVVLQSRRDPLEWSVSSNRAGNAAIIISNPLLWRSGDVVMLLEPVAGGGWHALDRYSRTVVLATAPTLLALAGVLVQEGTLRRAA